ncbi:MAG: DUF1844 domain-containing protein [Acidobacteriota bacterium]|nr:DUF1844 domain-containing protein [Acidobacteriota bacterium]
MAKEKQTEFVVSDRRKFTAEGDIRPDAPPDREEAPPAVAVAEQKASAAPIATDPATVTESARVVPAPETQGHAPDEPQMPPPLTDEELAQQKTAYDETNRKLDEQLKEKLAGREVRQFEMTFERFAASLYMTALLQLGMAAPEGEQPRVDIMGARQTIDTIALLQEKTKGNLTDAEKNMLQQALYELRMAWVEVMNAINDPPAVHMPGGPSLPSGPGPTRIK